jgi:Mg2+/Co2+ transporter CorC
LPILYGFRLCGEKIMTNQESEKVDKLLKKFDFKTCQIAMLIMDWNYKGTPVTIEELKKTAEDCLAQLINNGYDEFSTGGFTAKREYDGGDFIGITLTFELEEQWL